MASSEPLQEVLSRLDEVHGADNQWGARCPCRNDDEHPSLRISTGKEGQVIMACLKGLCDINQICEAMDLKVSDLWPKRKSKMSLKHVETYSYTDEDGNELMQVRRFLDSSGQKTFRQCVKLDSGELSWSTANIRKPLYRLPRVLKAIEKGDRVYVVEGEKDVHTMEELGHVATCNPGGASAGSINKWTHEHTETLAGASVIVVVDNDEAGDKHGRYVCSQLHAAGSNVRMFRPADYNDVSDVVEAGVELRDGLVEVDWDAEDNSLHNAVKSLSVEIGEIDDEQVEHVIAKVETLKDQFILQVTDEDFHKPDIHTWADFLGTEADDSYQWVIPDLLERQERVMIVAAEGVGKTTLARQVALLSAAGIHPFKDEPMPKITTLTIDLENPARIIRRTSKQIYNKLRWMKQFEGMDAHLLMKPEGVDLLRAEDRVLIETCVADVNPDVLFLGPMYKTYLDPGGRTSESIVLQVVKFLDRIRTVYDTALWLEHHAPLGSGGSRDLRPFGSAVWSRWSEFGLFLRPSLEDSNLIEFNHYRGQREERKWPKLCKKGKIWPFEVLEYHKGPPEEEPTNMKRDLNEEF